MKQLIMTVCLTIVLATTGLADVVYLNQGEEYSGILQKVCEESVILKPLQDELREFKREEIAHILLSKIREGDEITRVEDLTDPVAIEVMQNLPDPDEFPDANYITLYRLNEYVIEEDDNVTHNSRYLLLMVREPGLRQANQERYYYTERETATLNFGHTYSASGHVYHITDDAVSDESLFSSMPEYARLKKLKIALKKVDIGSVIDYSFTHKLSGTDELRPFMVSKTFGEREPVIKDELKIRFNKNTQIAKATYNWPNEGAPDFKASADETTNEWQWSYSAPKGIIPEQNMLPLNRIFPRVVVYRPFTWANVAADLASTYEQLKPSKDLISEILAGAKIEEAHSQLDKAARIYEFINRDIRNIGLAPVQMGSFIPVSPEITFQKKYGNPQARLTLMHFALHQLGITSKIAFASGRREAVTAVDHPSLSFTSQPILALNIDGQDYFCDSGSIYLPFGYLPIWLQGGKAAVLNQAQDDFHFVDLPRYTHEWNRFDRNVMVRIDENGDMQADEILVYRGPYEAGVRELKAMQLREQRNYAERRVKNVHPNALLIDYALSDLDDLNAPVILTLSYKIPQAAQKASDFIMTFTNFWVNYKSSSASLSEREYPMQYWGTEENQQNIIFILPDGFKWVNWDKQYQFTSGNVSFLSNMNQSGDRLIYSDRFTAYTDEFNPEDEYQNFRQCTLTMSELANQWIIIEREQPQKPLSEQQSLNTATESADLTAKENEEQTKAE